MICYETCLLNKVRVRRDCERGRKASLDNLILECKNTPDDSLTDLTRIILTNKFPLTVPLCMNIKFLSIAF